MNGEMRESELALFGQRSVLDRGQCLFDCRPSGPPDSSSMPRNQWGCGTGGAPSCQGSNGWVGATGARREWEVDVF